MTSLFASSLRRACATRKPLVSRARGFTLVEVMVAIAIGLFLSVVATSAIVSMGRQLRVVGATSQAQVNAQLGLSAIDEAGRMAGAGLFNGGQLVCRTLNAWRDGTLRSNGAVLLPARVISGGAGTASDRVIFTFANATGALSAMPVVDDMASAHGVIRVSDAATLASNDVAIVGVPGSATVPCTLFQVNNAPTSMGACGGNATQCKEVSRNVTPLEGLNPTPGTFATEPRYGFSASAAGVSGPAVVVRLGTEFRQVGFRVMCNTLVQYNDFADTPACTSAPLGFSGGANAVATDVVQMKVQYGVSADAASDVVAQWVNATGTWATPDVDAVARIKAVRVVLVSRSKEPEPTQVTAASCTNPAGVVNTGPCSFQDGSAPVIDLSAVSAPAGRTWRHFRYRVHQAVIPLRTVLWSS